MIYYAIFSLDIMRDFCLPTCLPLCLSFFFPVFLSLLYLGFCFFILIFWNLIPLLSLCLFLLVWCQFLLYGINNNDKWLLFFIWHHGVTCNRISSWIYGEIMDVTEVCIWCFIYETIGRLLRTKTTQQWSLSQVSHLKKVKKVGYFIHIFK